MCADAPFRVEETWIVSPMLTAYKKLHQQGQAHSIEVWQNEELVGGLYGIAVNGYFSGESMFYKQSNASKVALVYLAELLKSIKVELIDCQMLNPFLASMGCIEVNREQFIAQQLAAKTTKYFALLSFHGRIITSATTTHIFNINSRRSLI